MHRFNQIEMLVAVVEEASFTAAAERLNVSKSHVSRQIKELEEHLGVRLLNRTTRQVSVTSEGEIFTQRCANVIEEFERAERALTQRRTDPVGLLKVAAPMTFGVNYLSPVLAEFLETYEGVEVDVHFSDRMVDLVEEGFDVGLRIGSLDDSSLIGRKVRDVKAYICASPAYLEEHDRPDRPSDLKDHNCLQYSYLSAGNRWYFQRDDEETVVPVSGSFKANNGEALKEAALRDVGVVLAPEFILGEPVENNQLVRLFPEWSMQEGAIWLLYPHRRHLAAKVRHFVDFVRERLSD
jgi:DNA-binding transcriptional LysR family regulator